MKPDWKDAPQYANYLAMDDDGAWWWFENKPKFTDGVWFSDQGFLENAAPGAGDSLEARP